jgi:membrane-bound metal-dependent hydrolase YbcI (DUF457 family)
MAGFRTHIGTSCTLGAGYAALGMYHGVSIEASLVAGGFCGVGGMLPDIDSDSGVPVRETMGFAAAITPMLLVDRFEHLMFNYEQMVLAGGLVYLFVRFGIARLLMRYTVHRGMFHSIPALLLFTGIAFLISGSTNLHLRYFKAGGVFLGVLSHLMVDEIYAVEWTGGRWRFKKSFGTALKLWGDRAWGNFSVYSKLAVVAVLILSEPMIMEQYGQLSPVVVNTEALREKFLFARPGAQGAAGKSQIAGMPTPMPQAMLATSGPASFGEQQPGTTPWNVGPTAGSSPDVQHDRNIYDTARRLWQRFTH